jgi:hemoglobin
MKKRIVLAMIVLVGCGGSSAPKKTGTSTSTSTGTSTGTGTATGTLYERLGGKDAIVAVVKEFVDRTTTDPRIKHRFFNTDRVELERLLVELVCMAAGGPCKYSGRDMTSAHAGMELVDDEFDALVEDLVGALDKYNVPEREKGEVLGALGPMKPEIVVAADKLSPIDAEALAEVERVAAKIADKTAAELLAAAVVAGKRGQRSYAEQLFSRAEMIVGPKPLASIATVFRKGAPPRVAATKPTPTDAAAQPATVGSSDQDEPDPKPARGSLSGTLTLDGKPISGFGVVMLRPAKGKFKKRIPKQRIVEQRDKKFAPHVMAVPVGSTIAFPNFDPIFHNVFSVSKTESFDLGMYKRGELKEVVFDKPGLVRLGCNIHPAMSAFIIVVSDPHYAVVDGDGKFSFRSLAPGKYKVQAWSEQGGEPTVSSVVIEPGSNKATFDIASAKLVSVDKFGVAR